VIDPSPLRALGHAADALTQVGCPFALVGGLAVTIRSEVRFTRDIDLCVAVGTDEEAERLVFELGARGYSVVATVEHAKHARLATARLRGPSGVVCDLLMASSGIEREVTERATDVNVDGQLTVPVARVEELLALKVLSAVEGRPLDSVDFVRLVEFNPDFDEQAVRANLELIVQRGYDRDQDLPQKFGDLLRRARAG
jgi:hypothetical protein